MEESTIQAVEELINIMEYGFVGKLTKNGNTMIYKYFKALQEENKQLKQQKEEAIKFFNTKIKIAKEWQKDMDEDTEEFKRLKTDYLIQFKEAKEILEKE